MSVDFPKLPAGHQWEVEAAPTGRRAEVTVRIMRWGFFVVIQRSVYTWPNQTRDELRATTITAARRAYDDWQAQVRGDSIHDWAQEIQQELNS